MADGSVTVDTRINSDGFNKGMDDGVRNISKSLKSTMKAVQGAARGIGIAFWAGFGVAFLKKAIDSFSGISSNLGRELKALDWAFIQLQGAIVNVVAPAFAALFPYILSAIQFFTALFNQLAQISLAFFGVAASMNAAKLAQEQLTKAVGKGALASFDQLNVLEAKPMLPGVNLDPAILTQVEAFKNKVLELLQPAIDAFGRLKDALIPLGQTIWEGLKWAWDNILVPLGTWAITNLLPAFLDLLSAAAGLLNSVLIALQPAATWLWDNFLKPIAAWTGGAAVEILRMLADALKWIGDNLVFVRDFIIVVGIMVVALNFALDVFVALTTGVGLLSGVIAFVSGAAASFGAIIAFLTTPVTLTILAIGALIAVIVLLILHWDWVKQKAGEVWTTITQIWGIAGYYFDTFIVQPLKTAFKTFLDWLPESWRIAFEGVIGFVKNAVNTVIDFINGMIRAIGSGINFVISSLNSMSVTIPDWIPGIGGQTWGLNIPPLTPFQIPRLATGAVIPPNAAFAAILGDQRSGRNIEAPEGLIRQIIQEELGNIRADISIEFAGSLGELVRQLKPYIDKETVRIGAGMIRNATTNPIKAGGVA